MRRNKKEKEIDSAHASPRSPVRARGRAARHHTETDLSAAMTPMSVTRCHDAKEAPALARAPPPQLYDDPPALGVLIQLKPFQPFLFATSLRLCQSLQLYGEAHGFLPRQAEGGGVSPQRQRSAPLALVVCQEGRGAHPKRQEQEELSSPMPMPTLALKLSCLPDIPPEATKILRGASAARGKRHTVGMAHLAVGAAQAAARGGAARLALRPPRPRACSRRLS